MFTAQIEWDCPESFPDLSEAKYIAIDLETKDPDLKSKGSGAIQGRGEIVGITRAKEKLFITNQDYEYQYNIGGPLI